MEKTHSTNHCEESQKRTITHITTGIRSLQIIINHVYILHLTVRSFLLQVILIYHILAQNAKTHKIHIKENKLQRIS